MRSLSAILLVMLVYSGVACAEKTSTGSDASRTASAPAVQPGEALLEGAAALPAGVRFSVWATPWTMPGGADSGSDQFKFQLEGDEKAMRQIKRIDYLVDIVGTGDPRRNFFFDGAVERSRWPISAKITWRNGKMTEATLARP